MPSSTNTMKKSRRAIQTVPLTLEEHCTQVHQEALRYEERLKHLNNPEGVSANDLRTKICELGTELLLSSPAFATTHGWTDRLWRLCFYERIRKTRSARDRKERRQLDASVEQRLLTKHVTEAIQLYVFLLETLQTKLLQAYPDVSGLTALSNTQTTQDSAPPPTQSPAGVVECLIPLLVQLGDLHRYANQSAAAQAVYAKACQLGPGLGHAMNQLAVVVASQSDSGRVVTLYWYARSFTVTAQPFVTSTKNLARLFESNREWLQEQEQATTSPSKSGQTKLFLGQFCEWQSHLFHGKYDRADSNLGREQLQQLLNQSALGDGLLCKLVVIQAFAETCGAHGCPPDVRQPTSAAARRWTFWLGTALANRILALHDKGGTSQRHNKPSHRCLLPFLLTAEYLATSSTAENDSKADEAFVEFWTRVVDVFNAVPLNTAATVSLDESAKRLKEYHNLRAFAPFAGFIAPVPVSGRLDDPEAVMEIMAWNKSKNSRSGSESQSTTVSSTSSSSSADSAEQNRLKMARLAALAKKWLQESADGTFPGLPFTYQNGVYQVTPTTEDAEMTSPQEAVYHTSSADGRALLVPRFLLGDPTTTSSPPMIQEDDVMDTEPPVPTGNGVGPVVVTHKPALIHNTTTTTAAADSLMNTSKTAVPSLMNNSTTAPPPAAVLPPPGFGPPPGWAPAYAAPAPQPLYRLFDTPPVTDNPFASKPLESMGAGNSGTFHHLPPLDPMNLLFADQPMDDPNSNHHHMGLLSSILNDPPPPPTTNPFAT